MLLTEKSVMQTSVRVNVKVPSEGASCSCTARVVGNLLAKECKEN